MHTEVQKAKQYKDTLCSGCACEEKINYLWASGVLSEIDAGKIVQSGGGVKTVKSLLWSELEALRDQKLMPRQNDDVSS